MRGVLRKGLALALLGWVLADLSVACAIAQQPTLPANWAQLSPIDFAALIRPYVEQDTFKLLSDADQAALTARGADLFSKIDVSNTTLNYQTLEMLHWVGRSDVDQSVLEQAKNAVLSRRDDWAGKPYAEIRAKVVMMDRLHVPQPMLVTEARRWVIAGGTRAQVPEKDFGYEIARLAFSDVKIINGSFSVEWVGQLSAPETGDYTIFISPIDVNAGFKFHPLKFSMTVFLAGQAIISATPPSSSPSLSPAYQSGEPPKSNWVSQSNPVSLTAGRPVAIRVVTSVDGSDPPPGLLHATLFWQGPDIAKSLVPTSALSLAQTGKPGLQATYTWTVNGRHQSLTRLDPMIDFSWTNSPILLSQDVTISSLSADALWQTMTSRDFIAEYTTASPTLKLHPFLRDADDVSTGLSTGRRQAFLELILQTPELLDALDTKHAVRFYEAFRIGCPDKALDVFGAWAGRKADIGPDLSSDRVFNGDDCDAIASMAISTTQQFTGQASRLQGSYLQLPDGRCALPVAYTLAYSYLGRHRLADWIALLDGKLTDPTVTGDVRVNWLIARAQAQELVRTQIQHYPFHYSVPATWPLDGLQYLDRAIQAAQSPATKVQVAREIAARLAWSGQYEKAQSFLKQAASSLPTDKQTVVLAWVQQIAGFATAHAQYLQNRQSTAGEAYVKALIARRDAAASHGDADAMTRYDALLKKARGTQTNPRPGSDR
jgi:hypothetical protein